MRYYSSRGNTLVEEVPKYKYIRKGTFSVIETIPEERLLEVLL